MKEKFERDTLAEEELKKLYGVHKFCDYGVSD